MSSRRALTGGTGDVNPQYISVALNQSAADSTNTFALNIPVQRLPTGGKAQVMEVLKVSYESANFPGGGAATNSYR